VTGMVGPNEIGPELVGPTERGLRPPIMTGVVGPNEIGPATKELHCQSDTLAFQNDLDPEFSITMIFLWSTTIHQITVISATVEMNTATDIDQLYTTILYDKLIAWKPISDVLIDSSLHTHTVSIFLLRVFVDKAITSGSDDRGTDFGDIPLGVFKLLANNFRCQLVKQDFIQAELMHTEFSNPHMLVHHVGDDNSDTLSANYTDIQAIQQQEIAYVHIQCEVSPDTALDATVGSERFDGPTISPEMYSTSTSQLSQKSPGISLELYDELGILSDEIGPAAYSPADSQNAEIDPSVDPSNINIEAICHIGPAIRIAETVRPYTFGYQSDTTASIVLAYKQQTHDRKKFSMLATSFSAAIYMPASSRDKDMTCNSFHSRCDSTVGSANATFEVIEPETDPAFDQRVHISWHLYNSRAASLCIHSSIGGCISATTTATSTNAAPTTTTTRRQLLLAEFLSGG
jgi:hypothetical protein